MIVIDLNCCLLIVYPTESTHGQGTRGSCPDGTRRYQLPCMRSQAVTYVALNQYQAHSHAHSLFPHSFLPRPPAPRQRLSFSSSICFLLSLESCGPEEEKTKNCPRVTSREAPAGGCRQVIAQGVSARAPKQS